MGLGLLWWWRYGLGRGRVRSMPMAERESGSGACACGMLRRHVLPAGCRSRPDVCPRPCTPAASVPLSLETVCRVATAPPSLVCPVLSGWVPELCV